MNIKNTLDAIVKTIAPNTIIRAEQEAYELGRRNGVIAERRSIQKRINAYSLADFSNQTLRLGYDYGVAVALGEIPSDKEED